MSYEGKILYMFMQMSRLEYHFEHVLQDTVWHQTLYCIQISQVVLETSLLYWNICVDTIHAN